MNAAPFNLPALGLIAAALRKTTEWLACELRSPTTEPPLWNEFEWRIARAVTAMQGIAPLLLKVLQWAGPEDWRQFLREQKSHVAGRHRRIEQLLNEIDMRARAKGIPLLPLKGAALHSIGIYQPGDRPMADVDLLARCNDVGASTQLLNKCGFEVAYTNWRHQLFESPLESWSHAGLGEHVRIPIKIELRTAIQERLPVSSIDITEFMFPLQPRPGLNDYSSADSLMMHLLLHAAGTCELMR